MRAITVQTFGDPSTLTLTQVEDPSPEVGQVLVRLHAAGVNPVDTYIRAGVYPAKPELPYTPGMDGAGVIEAIAEGAFGDCARALRRGFREQKVGDRVWLYAPRAATSAERCVVDPWSVQPLPDGVTFQQGACLGVPYATAWRSLIQVGDAQPGDRVLVHGASGGVGIAAVQIAVALGMHVIGTAGTPRGMDLVRSLGAEAVFDHGLDGYQQLIRDELGSAGFDVILEMLANVNLRHDLDLVAPRGRVVIVGSRGEIAIDPRATMGKNAQIRGMSLLSATAAELAECHAGIVGGLRAGWLRPVIQHEFDLADAAKAHEAVMAPGHAGQTVLTIGS